MRRYLIVGFQRSGTTVTHLLVEGHPQVSALKGELRAPFYTQGLTAFTGGYLDPQEQARQHVALFDAVTGIRGGPEVTYHGAKTVINSPQQAAAVVRVLRESFPEMKVIMIRRDDWAAQFGSSLHRHRTGVAHSWRREGEWKVQPVTINPLLFRLYAVRVRDTLREIARLHESHDTHVIDYARFCRDLPGEYAKVLDFLDLPYVEPVWLKSEKLMPAPEEYITNYASMRKLADAIAEGRNPHSGSLVAAKLLQRVYALPKRLRPGSAAGV